MTVVEVLIFQTDILTHGDLRKIAGQLEQQPGIHRWTVDTEDVDCVLRVVASGMVSENTIIRLVKDAGFFCNEMPG